MPRASGRRFFVIASLFFLPLPCWPYLARRTRKGGPAFHMRAPFRIPSMVASPFRATLDGFTNSAALVLLHSVQSSAYRRPCLPPPATQTEPRFLGRLLLMYPLR